MPELSIDVALAYLSLYFVLYAQTPFFLASPLQPSHFAQLGTPLIFHLTYLLLYFTLIFARLPFIFVQNFPFDQKWRAEDTNVY